MKTPKFSERFELYNNGKSPGLAVMAVKNGELEFKKGYGYSNIEKKEKIDNSTSFRLASVSKSFTALAIAILEEQNKLDPEDKIVKYFYDFPDYGKQITIQHLIHNISGLPAYWVGSIQA